MRVWWRRHSSSLDDAVCKLDAIWADNWTASKVGACMSDYMLIKVGIADKISEYHAMGASCWRHCDDE